MSDNLRRALFGSTRRRPSAGEVIGSAVLDHLTKEPKREPNVPLDPTLPAELQGIIESSDDYSISRRGHHTKCWLWRKNRMRINDPETGRKKDVTEVIYRVYSGRKLPGGLVIQPKCGQPRCINYEHYCTVTKREGDIVHTIRTREAVDPHKEWFKMMATMSKKYKWTEKEQTLIFNVTIMQLREEKSTQICELLNIDIDPVWPSFPISQLRELLNIDPDIPWRQLRELGRELEIQLYIDPDTTRAQLIQQMRQIVDTEIGTSPEEDDATSEPATENLTVSVHGPATTTPIKDLSRKDLPRIRISTQQYEETTETLPDPDGPDIIELDIPPEPDRPLPEPKTPPEPETPPERPTPPEPETRPEPQTPPRQSVPAAPKSKTTAALLAFLLGGLGAHKFYLGYTGAGLIHLGLTLTVIGALVNVPVCVIEFLIYLSKSEEEFHQTYVVNKKRFF